MPVVRHDRFCFSSGAGWTLTPAATTKRDSHVFTAPALTRTADTTSRQPRGWLPQQLYKGHVAAVGDDGGVEVMVNGQLFHASAGHPPRPGDLLSLRLLGTEPAPHFAVVGVLRREDLQQQAAVHLRASWQEAVQLLRQQEPGIMTLLGLWQRYPQQLAQLSAQLPPLLGALHARSLPREALLAPGRLKAHGSSSWSFGDAGTTPEDGAAEAMARPLLPLLARLLQLLQPGRELRLERDQAVVVEREDAPAQSLQPLVALYRNEQESDTQAPLLRQLLSVNVEQALLALVSSQLHTLPRNGPNLSIWIMQLLLRHGTQLLPVDLLCQQQVRAGEQRWQLDFGLELPLAGRIEVTLLVKFPAVALRLASPDGALLERWRARQDTLARALRDCGLKLDEFVCVDGTQRAAEHGT